MINYFRELGKGKLCLHHNVFCLLLLIYVSSCFRQQQLDYKVFYYIFKAYCVVKDEQILDPSRLDTKSPILKIAKSLNTICLKVYTSWDLK